MTIYLYTRLWWCQTAHRHLLVTIPQWPFWSSSFVLLGSLFSPVPISRSHACSEPLPRWRRPWRRPLGWLRLRNASQWRQLWWKLSLWRQHSRRRCLTTKSWPRPLLPRDDWWRQMSRNSGEGKDWNTHTHTLTYRQLHQYRTKLSLLHQVGKWLIWPLEMAEHMESFSSDPGLYWPWKPRPSGKTTGRSIKKYSFHDAFTGNIRCSQFGVGKRLYFGINGKLFDELIACLSSNHCRLWRRSCCRRRLRLVRWPKEGGAWWNPWRKVGNPQKSKKAVPLFIMFVFCVSHLYSYTLFYV